MKYYYEENAVRWFKWHSKSDVRGHRCQPGWQATADLIERHPITSAPFRRPQWWIRETLTAPESQHHPSH